MWKVYYIGESSEYEDVDQKRAERIIRETYNNADDIISHAKSDQSFEVRTMFAWYKWVIA